MGDSHDLWSQEEFEAHIASVLSSLYDKNIRGVVRRNPNKAGRLTDEQLAAARKIGPYFPCARPDRSHGHVLCTPSCLAPPEMGRAVRGVCLIEPVRHPPPGVVKCGDPFVRAGFLLFLNGKRIDGFSVYFGLSSEGAIRWAEMDAGPSGDGPASVAKEIRGMIMYALQAEAERRIGWQIEARQGRVRVVLGCRQEHVESLFYACGLPLSLTGRAGPILHWVKAHRRRMQRGAEGDLPEGLQNTLRVHPCGVRIGDTVFRVEPPETRRENRRRPYEPMGA